MEPDQAECFNPQRGTIQKRPILTSLEELEKRSFMCQARVESLFSRLRCAMDNKPLVHPQSEAMIDTLESDHEDVPSDVRKITSQIRGIKKVIQNAIDLMVEIEERLEL